MQSEIQRALAVLKDGGVILYPTDTVWGIGCDATDCAAVERIYRIKKRADNKAMILLVDSAEAVKACVGTIPQAAMPFLDDASRPTTIVYGHCSGVCARLLGADGSAGIRVTREDFSRELCRALGHPLVSTSANISGQPTPQCFADISPEILAEVDYAVCHGRATGNRHPQPSKVIKITDDGKTIVLRP